MNHQHHVAPDDLPAHLLADALTLCRQLRDGGAVVTGRDTRWAAAMRAGRRAGLLRVAIGPDVEHLTARRGTPFQGRRGN